MQIGDQYAYMARMEDDQPVRHLAFLLRIDDPGFGLDVPQLTCYVVPTTEDPNYNGTPFQSSTGLYPYGTNIPNTFEPISAPD